ncbi:glycosyltransferase family 4 protein [Niallia taxi]|uniref:glycosyltransferase family 4 protein n=1 Tax=Niallia taxi TaxID=2499688 RepID=UPI00317FB6E4
MSKIKVLMMGSHNSVKGGITSVITQMLNHNWDKESVEMKFLPTYVEGGAFKRIFYFLKSYIKFLTLILTYKPDLLHIHMSHNASFYRKYIIHKTCKIFGIKDVVHLHSSEFKGFYSKGSKRRKQRIRSLLKECDRVFVLGDKWNETIVQMESQAKTVVLNNTVALPKVTTNMESKTLSILFLGVLVERKGVMDLLKAADKLNKEGILGNYHVKFKIGGTGSEEEKLKQYVNSNELSDFVDFLGWVSGEGKNKFLSDSQIFVLPSYNEGLPISILEAISWGIPVVSTEVGSVNEAVINDYNGHIVRPGEVNSLTEALKRVIVDENLRLKYSENSRILAEEKFDDKYYYQAITNAYKKILNK